MSIIHSLWLLQLWLTPCICVGSSKSSMQACGPSAYYIHGVMFIAAHSADKCTLYIFYISFPNYFAPSYENRELQTWDWGAGSHISVFQVHLQFSVLIHSVTTTPPPPRWVGPKLLRGLRADKWSVYTSPTTLQLWISLLCIALGRSIGSVVGLV